jgi:hypothetical protein
MAVQGGYFAEQQIASELDVASVWRFDVIGLAQLHGCGAELP